MLPRSSLNISLSIDNFVLIEEQLIRLINPCSEEEWRWPSKLIDIPNHSSSFSSFITCARGVRKTGDAELRFWLRWGSHIVNRKKRILTYSDRVLGCTESRNSYAQWNRWILIFATTMYILLFLIIIKEFIITYIINNFRYLMRE